MNYIVNDIAIVYKEVKNQENDSLCLMFKMEHCQMHFHWALPWSWETELLKIRILLMYAQFHEWSTVKDIYVIPYIWH